MRRATRTIALTLAVVLAAVAAACSDGGGDGDGDDPVLTTTTTTEEAGPPEAEPLPTGTVTETGPATGCPAGGTECRGVEVSCPGLSEDLAADIDVREAFGRPRGVALFFSGAGGTNWWTERGEGNSEDDPGAGINAGTLAFLDELTVDGLTVIEIRWRNSWLHSAPGEDAGTSGVACRGATIIRWIHEEFYEPLGLEPSDQRCGFCATGNSGGSTLLSYALAFYGLDDLFDVVIPTSGPPHAAQALGCLHQPGEEPYWYSESNIRNVDASYGAEGIEGPCARADASFVDRWRAESVDTGGNDYFYEDTLVAIVVGGRDPTMSPEHGQLYFDALEAAGSPHLSFEVVERMPHGVNRDGLEVLRGLLAA